jgi:hypothetical protein
MGMIRFLKNSEKILDHTLLPGEGTKPR